MMNIFSLQNLVLIVICLVIYFLYKEILNLNKKINNNKNNFNKILNLINIDDDGKNDELIKLPIQNDDKTIDMNIDLKSCVIENNNNNLSNDNHVYNNLSKDQRILHGKENSNQNMIIKLNEIIADNYDENDENNEKNEENYDDNKDENYDENNDENYDENYEKDAESNNDDSENNMENNDENILNNLNIRNNDNKSDSINIDNKNNEYNNDNLSENYEVYSNDNELKKDEVIEKKKNKMVRTEGDDNRIKIELSNDDKLKELLKKNKLAELQQMADKMKINKKKIFNGKEKNKTKLELATDIINY